MVTGQAVCRRLWCTAPLWDHHQQCHTQHMPWADGTPCGVDKWCHRGECVSRRNLEPVDGQWGEWGRYGECSRTCGGGIKRKYRECDNPAPKNGGNYCIGERVKYRSCGTRECPPGSSDFRYVLIICIIISYQGAISQTVRNKSMRANIYQLTGRWKRERERERYIVIHSSQRKNLFLLFSFFFYREQQCSKFDNNNFNIQNLARDVKWHAKYTRSKRLFILCVIIYIMCDYLYYVYIALIHISPTVRST